jgi:hypothetical protein
MTTSRRRSLASRAGRLETDVSRILEAANPAYSIPTEAPALILTIGLPGSGKSTFCRRLAPQIDAVVLESDAIRRQFFGAPTYSQTESRRLFSALHAAARELLLHGRNVIVDATNLRESDRRPAYSVADETGAHLMLLTFSAPQDVIEQRLTRRVEAPDAADNSSADLGVYFRMAERAQMPLREHFSVDTSSAASIEAARSRVVEACRPQAGRVTGGIL